MGFLVPGIELLLGPLLQLPIIEGAEGGLDLGLHMAPGQDPVLLGFEGSLDDHMVGSTTLSPLDLKQLLQVRWQAVVDQVNLGLLLMSPLGPGEPLL